MSVMHICKVLCITGIAGCATAPAAPIVATDVMPVGKPVPIGCEIDWPAKPTPYVAQVQLTGKPHVDALLVWRAAEAEIEARIAYENKLEAAASACVRPDGG